MNISITGTVEALTEAINDFKAKYHQDYFDVRAAAVDYLSQPPNSGSVKRLVSVLLPALKSWGAGKRGAPGCQSHEIAAQNLSKPSLHEKLSMLANSFEYLTVTNGARGLKSGCAFSTVLDFDRCLIDTLNELAEASLINNTAVTYPMKALLLITGLMPAFDSQVKDGIKNAGMSGVRKDAQYLLPKQHGCAGSKKICVLPFYIADCVSRHSALLNAAIDKSKYPNLKDQYGRLFDVLLFVQAGNRTLISFRSSAPFQRWYQI